MRSANAISPVSGAPPMSPRDAVTRCEIGFASTNASSPLGSVSGSTNVFERKVMGNSAMKPPFMTAFGERSSRPIVMNTHASPNEKTTTSPIAATVPGTESGRNPRITPTRMTTTAAIA